MLCLLCPWWDERTTLIGIDGNVLHPVSITRFPLRMFSSGAGLLRYVFFIGSGYDFPGAGSEKTGIF